MEPSEKTIDVLVVQGFQSIINIILHLSVRFFVTL